MSYLPQNQLQLTAEYKSKLNPSFLKWYNETFTNTRHLYAHWPVSGCHGDFVEYHIVIGMDDDNVKPVVYNNTPITQDLYSHTDGRNEDSWSISIDGFGDANTQSLGTEVCYPVQLSTMTSMLITQCIDLHVPVGNLMSHAEAGDNRDFPSPNADGIPAPPAYGPTTTCTRWDFFVLINPKDLSLSEMKGLGWDDPVPAGQERFMDWVRGQVMLGIQNQTKGKW
jgi:hypothetical protein